MADNNKIKDKILLSFSTVRSSISSIKSLKKSQDYSLEKKTQVVLGIINRIKASISITKDPSKIAEFKRSLRIWEKYHQELSRDKEEEGQDIAYKKDTSEEQPVDDDGGLVNLDQGEYTVVTTKERERGIVVRLTTNNKYSIYYWEKDPADIADSNLWINGKRLTTPIKMIHLGALKKSGDGVSSDDIKEKPAEKPKDPSVSENKKYYSGLSKSTSSKRKDQFDKQTDMPDDDPKAYKKAPGDDKETKPSKYTKKYNLIYNEDLVHKFFESVNKGLEKKSKESGISLSILKKVYDRGMAAWKSGHRPGATQHQWAMARVNSFIVGGKTRTTADKDLWAKVDK